MPASSNISPNFYYNDTSGFCFDLPPRDVAWGWGNVQAGGIYDIPTLPMHNRVRSYIGWTNWITKFQKDWRFAAVSDSNAKTQEFPEVYDPWMFTEYVFRGLNRTSDRDDAVEKSVSIVTPPMVMPLRLVRTNDEGTINARFSYINPNHVTTVPEQQHNIYAMEDQWKSLAGEEKTYWASELDVMEWRENLPDGSWNFEFQRTGTQRRIVNYAVPNLNSGVRLYRHQVWAESLRWGQSQNIPSRSLTCSSIREWFEPTSRTTGRIVPHVQVRTGQPVYENVGAQQFSVFSQDLVVGMFSNNAVIALFPVTPSGANGPSDSVFSYATYASAAGGTLVDLPRREGGQVALRYVEKNFSNSDLIHRGCAFWEGSIGFVRCSLHAQSPTQFGVLSEKTFNYSNVNDVVSQLALDTTVYRNEEDIVVQFSSESHPAWIDMAACGKVAAMQFGIGESETSTLRISQLAGSMAVKPLADISAGGFVASPGAWAKIRVQKVNRRRPVTHSTLCGSYNGNDSTEAITNYKASMTAAGFTPCPFYQPTGKKVLAAFEGLASNGAEWAALQRGLPPGQRVSSTDPRADAALALNGLGIGGDIMMHIMYPGLERSTNPYTRGQADDERTRVEISYSPETVAVGKKQTYYDTPNGMPPERDPGSAIRVRRGTGEFPVDEKTNEPFGGIDTPFFSMVNQINWRIMRSSMSCYKPTNCDPIITVSRNASGFIRGRFSNINFVGHALATQGYPAIDGTNSYCHYGGRSCPSARTDRRATEFDENYKILREEILLEFRLLGIAAFEAFGIEQKFIDDNGKVVSLTQAEVETLPRQSICVAARRDLGGGPPLIGHWQPLAKDPEGNNWRIFFYYNYPSWDARHHESSLAAHLVQFDNENHPCYIDTSGADAPTIALLNALFTDHTKIPWLVELHDNYKSPDGNPIEVTNALPFAGGRNPEYKDHSKRGSEVLNKWGGYTTQSGLSGGNQFGGPLWGRASVSQQATRGYWTDKDGEFLIRGTAEYAMPPWSPGSPGIGGFAPVELRIVNKPEWYGNAPPIHGVPGITIQNRDPALAALNRTGDYASVAATYANDTAELLDWLNTVVSVTYTDEGVPISHTNWSNMLPTYTNDQGEEVEIPVAAPNANRQMLPRSRHVYRCGVCGIRFTNEEFNYFATLPERISLPDGATAPGSPWVTCPRNDGGFVTLNATEWDMIPPATSRGMVDFWAPPGTTVRHDGYFWRNPPMITRVHEDQIRQKLGPYNATGGGYSFASFTTNVEEVGRLPQSVGGKYEPGLLRQMIVPWAAPGDSVALLRTKLKRWFALDYGQSLGFTSVAYVYRPSSGVAVVVTNEDTFLLAESDILYFERQKPGSTPRRLGILIAVSSGLPSALMTEPIIQDDLDANPLPDPTNYPATEGGFRQLDEDMRQWIMQVASGSLQRWGSSLFASKNAFADYLLAHGKDPNLGKSYSPGAHPAPPPVVPGVGAGPIEIDERIIAPYTEHESGGIQIVTVDRMKRLRNQILPMLAYDLSVPGYTAGGDYTRDQQAAHLDRFTVNQERPIPVPKWGTIEPQIIAYNQTGVDYYVEWDEGDLLGTRSRAYYPIGTTWWRINQVVGQIKRFGGTNPLHMDDSTGNSDIPYTGNEITSVAAYFLHGKIPMDKDIAKAYVVFTPDDGPTAAALGCKGLYDGFIGQRVRPGYGFKDNIAPGTERYVGSEQCYWMHFHPWTTSHEADIGSYNRGNTGGAYYNDHGGYAGPESRQHWLNGGNPDPGTYFFLSDERPVFLQTALYGSKGFEPNGYFCWFNDDRQTVYEPGVKLLGMRFYDTSYGFGFSQPFFGAWTWGQDIQQLLTEHQIWKDVPQDVYTATLDRYSAQARASVNTIGNIVTFPYIATPFRRQVWAREQQAIPNWINYSTYDTSGWMPRKIEMEETYEDTGWANGPQVIVQSEGEGSATVADPGINNAGNVARVLDVTQTLNRIYKDRVSRFFVVQTGAAWDEINDRVAAVTDTNLGTVERFHIGSPGGGQWQPLYFWNYRYVGEHGMWLGDPWHHPQLSNDKAVGQPGPGDLIPQLGDDRQGRIAETSAWDDLDLASDQGDYLKHHPLALTVGGTLDGSTLVEFTESDVAPTVPAPQGPTGRYWRLSQDKRATNWFTMDLRQVPYETSRRPWRYRRPTVESSSAICPNPSCLVHQNGWTVAEFYERATNTWGINVIPSLASDVCAFCHTQMTEDDGVAYLDGDGITTVAYDPQQSDNPYLRAIEISTAAPEGQTWFASARHGFVVEYMHSDTGQWRTLFAVSYSPSTGKYKLRQWSDEQHNWVYVDANELPEVFLGAEAGAEGMPRYSEASDGAHFIATGAQKIRFKVTHPAVVPVQEPVSPDVCVPNSTGRTITISSTLLSEPIGRYRGRTIALFNVDDEVIFTSVIESVAAAGPGLVALTIRDAFTNASVQFQISWTAYVARCSKFRPYGFSYAPGELLVVPPGSVEPILPSIDLMESSLVNTPSQISRVECQCGDDFAVTMQEATSIDNDFVWEVEESVYAGFTYLRIKGGKWFYDYSRNVVVLPSLYRDPSGLNADLFDLNGGLYNNPDSGFNLQTRPSMLHVEYFSGLGIPVETACKAWGPGPSYQLDSECVCFIKGSSDPGDDTEALPQGESSDTLAAMGYSVRLKNNGGTKIPLYWGVYNHRPIFWKSELGWIAGNELGSQGNDSSIGDLFTGGKGMAVADIEDGSDAVIKGFATGALTLYGPPNALVSGRILAYAKAITTRRMTTPSGIVTTHERTGGYRSGMFVFRLTIDGTWTSGRKSISCSTPRVLIYLKERQSTSNPAHYEP